MAFSFNTKKLTTVIRVIFFSGVNSQASYNGFLDSCKAISENFVIVDIHSGAHAGKWETIGLVYFPELGEKGDITIIEGNQTL